MTMESFYPIRNAEGRWTISGGTAPPMSRDFGTPEEAAEAFRNFAWRMGGGDVKVIRRTDGSIERIDMPPLPVAPAKPRELSVKLPPAFASEMDRVMSETGDDAGAVFSKAFALYVAALKEHNKGMFIGSAKSPDVLDTEFVGF